MVQGNVQSSKLLHVIKIIVCVTVGKLNPECCIISRFRSWETGQRQPIQTLFAKQFAVNLLNMNLSIMYNKSILARITDPACFACNIQLDILICPITWSAPSEYRGILRNLYNWHSSVLPGAGNKQFPCWSMWTPYIFALPKSILCPCAPILHWIISPGYCRPVPKNCCWNHEDYALFIPGLFFTICAYCTSFQHLA